MRTRRNWAEEARLNEARLEAVLRLSHMTEAPLREVTDFALEQAVKLTGSQIGYLAFVNDDETVLTMHSWSKEAMRECEIADKPLVYPLETTGLWGEAVRQRKPIITNDYSAPSPLKKGMPQGHVSLRRHMNVPIFDADRIVVVAGVGNKEWEYDDADVRQLTLLMEGMWSLVLRQRVQAELRRHRDHLEQLVSERTEALRRLLAAHDHDRRMIAFELHDGLTQLLVAASMQLQVARQELGDAPEQVLQPLEAGQRLLAEAIKEARALIGGLRPAVLEERGVEAAVRELATPGAGGGPEVQFLSDLDGERLAPALENAIYRIVQEGIANVRRHSKSQRARVELLRAGDNIRIVVQDWGVGFDAAGVQEGGFGLQGIRERARALGGEAAVQSSPGKGTRITVNLPAVGPLAAPEPFSRD